MSGVRTRPLWHELISPLTFLARLVSPAVRIYEINNYGRWYDFGFILGVSEFTSFVAIDQRVRRQDGRVETVKQPLPLPEGVSDLAVGGAPSQVRAVRLKRACCPWSLCRRPPRRVPTPRARRRRARPARRSIPPMSRAQARCTLR